MDRGGHTNTTHTFTTHQHVHSRSELHSTDTCRRRAEKQPKKRMRRDPNMNSGGRAPADMGGEPPNGRAKGQRASSQNRMFRGPLKRRRLYADSVRPRACQRPSMKPDSRQGPTHALPSKGQSPEELRMCHIVRRRYSPRKLERQSLMSRTRTTPLRVGKKGAETSAGHQAPKPSAA